MNPWLNNYVHVTDNSRSGGGTYTDQPWRIVFHSTEFDISELEKLKSVVRRHFAPPHLWYRPANRLRVQSVPLDRSGFALARSSGDPQTNKARALQVELVGHAADLKNLSDQELKNIALDVVVPFVEWARSQGGDVALEFHGEPGLADGRYGKNAATRMSWKSWYSFNGITSHYGVPGQSHWDTGTLDTKKIIAYAKAALGEGGDYDMTKEEYDRLYKNVDNTRVWLKPKLEKLQSDVDALQAEVDELKAREHAAPVHMSPEDHAAIVKAIVAEIRSLSFKAN